MNDLENFEKELGKLDLEKLNEMRIDILHMQQRLIAIIALKEKFETIKKPTMKIYSSK